MNLKNIRILEKGLFYAMMISWAVSCGMAAHQGRYLDAFTFFIGGCVILLWRNELENARMAVDEMANDGEHFIKATSDEEGITVVAGGRTHEVIKCICAIFTFYGKYMATEVQYTKADPDICDFFNEAFYNVVASYCDAKGVDKDDIIKRFNLRELD